MAGPWRIASLDQGSDRIDHAELGVPTTLLLDLGGRLPVAAVLGKLVEAHSRRLPGAALRPGALPFRGPRFWQGRRQRRSAKRQRTPLL